MIDWIDIKYGGAILLILIIDAILFTLIGFWIGTIIRRIIL